MNFVNSWSDRNVSTSSPLKKKSGQDPEYGLEISGFGWHKFVPYSRVKYSKTILKLSRRHIRQLKRVLTFADTL